MIAVAPRKPGTDPLAACGYTAKTPMAPAKSFWNLPRAGSSGRTTSRQSGHGMDDGVEDAAGDQLARRVLRRHQVVQDLRDDRVLQLRVDGVEQVRGVLLEPAEGVAAPVRAREGEALRLLPADAEHGREPPRLLGEVEDLDADRGPPGRAVVGPEEEAVQPSRLVGPRDDGPAGRRLLGREGRGAQAEGEGRGRDQPSGGGRE